MSTSKMPGFGAEASLYTTSVHYRAESAPDGIADRPGVLPQLANDGTTWTTSDICKACGCTVSGFQCNCGLRPDPTKLACIQNGGPSRTVAVFGGAGFTTGFSRAAVA